jgi:hypothetical protein
MLGFYCPHLKTTMKVFLFISHRTYTLFISHRILYFKRADGKWLVTAVVYNNIPPISLDLSVRTEQNIVKTTYADSTTESGTAGHLTKSSLLQYCLPNNTTVQAVCSLQSLLQSDQVTGLWKLLISTHTFVRLNIYIGDYGLIDKWHTHLWLY